MRVITDLSAVPDDIAPTAITIGKFDGLHFGHLSLVSQLHAEARRRSLNPVVVTFDRHPASVFAPDTAPPPIVSMRQKLALLRRQGLEATVVVPFTPAFAALEPDAFVEHLLVERLGVRLLLVGADFRFGRGGAGDVEFLAANADRYGYELVVARDEHGPAGRRASSTWIRELLAAGDVATVAEMLGRAHVLEAEVVHGAKRGREIGFPTANLSPDIEGLVPGDGVYACWFHDGTSVFPAAISIGNNPTFEGVPQRQVEAYVIDETLDLYGRRVQIAFVDRIRSMHRFASVAELTRQLGADVAVARRMLGVAGAETLPPS